MLLDSEGHRRNIEGAAWDLIGIGAYKGPSGKKVWTILFVDECPTPSASRSPSGSRSRSR
jgi:hypothetical protein